MMKKLVLLGAAGLAALSISCSDDETEDASGSFTKAFNVTVEPLVSITLAGEIKANDGIKISDVAIKANSKDVNFVTGEAPTVPSAEVLLDGKRLNYNSVCGELFGSQTFNFVITVTFDDSTKITAEKGSVTVNCGAAPVALVPFEVVLSSAGNSYYDIDDKTTYGNAAAKNKAEDIDVFAFGVKNNSVGKVYRADEDSDFEESTATIREIPVEGQAQAKTVLDSSPTAAILTGLIAGQNLTSVASVDIANDKVFMIESSDGDYYAVILKESNISGKTVKLKAFFL